MGTPEAELILFYWKYFEDWNIADEARRQIELLRALKREYMNKGFDVIIAVAATQKTTAPIAWLYHKIDPDTLLSGLRDGNVGVDPNYETQIPQWIKYVDAFNEEYPKKKKELPERLCRSDALVNECFT